MKKLKLSKIHLFIPGVITISIMCLSTKNPISIDIKIPAIIYEHTGSINSSVSAELKALGIKLMARDSTIVNEINNTVKLYGDAELSNKGIDVKAEFIEIDLNAKKGSAKGNVSYHDLRKNIKSNSDQISFNL